MRPISKILLSSASLAVLAFAAPAYAQEAHRYKIVDANGNIQALIAKHAAAYGVPELLIRRVIHRESRGNPRVISKGNYGLMQIRLGTARAMGYRGGTQGLLDADTNMTYAVKYLANAYKVAGGNHDRAVALYAGGYYYAAKAKGMLKDVDPNAGLTANASAVEPSAIKSADVATAPMVMRTVNVANLP